MIVCFTNLFSERDQIGICLIDRLGDDIPLGGHCHHTAWQEGLQVVDLTREDDGVHEVGVDGVYELVFHSTRTFA